MPVPPYVVAATVTGPSHRRDGRSGQDAYAYRLAPDGLVASVADGLGSAPWGGLGARLAVAAAIDARSPAEGIVAARVALESAAAEMAAPLGEFACTLLVCSAAAEEVTIAHVGDGGAVVDCGAVLSPPADSEYVEEVEPLTSPGWAAATRVSRLAGAGAFALFTDGCQRAALTRRPGGWSAHGGWWRPLFHFARSEPDAEQLAAFLSGPRMSAHSDDDKTLLIAVLR